MTFTYSKGVCKLNSPITIGSEVINERHWIEVSNGVLKVDLAPLPGLHIESLEESLKDFKSQKFLTPSALFVKECFDIFTSIMSVEVDSNSLQFIDLEQNPSSIASSLEENQIYKIKIGRNDLYKESSWLKDFIKNLPKNTQLRLDGNRNFTAATLNSYLDLMDLEKIQYLEEPLKDVMSWTELERRDELSLALDENIALRRSLDFAKYLVAKPTFNISLRETLRELALENQEVIVSNAFDPPNNINILKMIASEGDQVCGLDTLKYFNLDSLKVSPL